MLAIGALENLHPLLNGCRFSSAGADGIEQNFAGPRGFEPRSLVLETNILPLNYSPSNLNYKTYLETPRPGSGQAAVIPQNSSSRESQIMTLYYEKPQLKG